MKDYEIVAVRSTRRESWKCYEIEWKPLKEEPPPGEFATWKNNIKTNLRLSTS